MLGLGSGSNTTSSVTSPVTSPVPLGGVGYDESYTMMSPTAGDPHGGLTVITSHSRTASLTSNSRHHETGKECVKLEKPGVALMNISNG